MNRAKKLEIARFIKYCLVGILNTLLCLGTIFLCKSVTGCNEYVANAIGYAIGVANSFLWNKQWVFHSKGRLPQKAVLFLIGCGICYLLQLLTVWLLLRGPFGSSLVIRIAGFVISGYGLATLAGNIVYTVCNFIYNRLVTFRQS